MEPIDLLIANALVVTQNERGEIFPNGAVAVRGREIVAVGPAAEIAGRYRAARTIEAGERCVFPGLVNTHTHLFQTFMKGLGEGIHVHSWIRAITTPGLLQMGERDFYLSAMIGCLETIRGGATTLVEFMYPNPRHDMQDVVLRAMVDSGIRGFLGRGVADIADAEGYPRYAFSPDLYEPLPEAMDDCARLLKLCERSGEGRIAFCLAPPHMRCIRPETFGVMKEFADRHGCPITMHVCETPYDDVVIGERHEKLAVQWLEELGFLGPNLLAAHCVHLVEDGIARFAANGVKVSHNPVSNMILGNGVAPVPRLREQKVVVGLGSDGAASNNTQDLLEAMKAAVLLQRAVKGDPSVLSGRDALRMATIDGAQAVGLGEVIGSLEPGKRADLVLANFYQPKSVGFFDPINTLVFSADPRAIDTVIIDGQVVLENGHFTKIDEEALVHEAQAAAESLARRAYGQDVLRAAVALERTGEPSHEDHRRRRLRR